MLIVILGHILKNGFHLFIKFRISRKTRAEAFNYRASLAQSKLSYSQHPKNPVPPVMKIRWPPHFFPQVVGVRQDMIEVVGKGV
jgi:hypothetical protein